MHVGPDKICEVGAIFNIHAIEENKILFGTHSSGCFCYDVKGNEVEMDKITEPIFYIDYESWIYDLKNKC